MPLNCRQLVVSLSPYPSFLTAADSQPSILLSSLPEFLLCQQYAFLSQALHLLLSISTVRRSNTISNTLTGKKYKIKVKIHGEFQKKKFQIHEQNSRTFPGLFQVMKIPGLFQVFQVFQVAEHPV